MKPTEVNILGQVYKIEYCKNASEVDIDHRQSLWGQIDYWTQTIRVYDNNSPEAKIMQTLIHEVLHGIAGQLHMKLNKEENHDELDILAMSLYDVMKRNDWLKD